jgi:hypothetical protein
MFGAVGWGTCTLTCLYEMDKPKAFSPSGSDLMGRSAAFNATLFFTSLFGVATSLATSFPMLCITIFFLGSAVGVRLVS